MKNMLTTTALIAALALPTLATADGHSAMDSDAQYGGNITITYKDDVATLDPAIGYDWQNWSMIKSLYDGLMDYEPGTTDLRPGLAESYEISDDGMTFTFKLREGVKFHNGREMTAEDVKYSLDRVTDPVTQSPGAGFFGSIAGFDAASAGGGEGLSGVTVVDPYSVQIQLSRPDATFLHVMGLNFASVVASEAVEAAGADFGKTAMGTGAFKLSEWTIGQRLVFEKNADYWREGLPYLDSVTFEVGQEPIVALLRLQNGRPRTGLARDRRRAAAYRLYHPERQYPAFRQRRRAQGRQHGDQQGADHTGHQRSCRARDTAAAAIDAGLH